MDDFHIHLRQGKLMETVCDHLNHSGVRLAYVMPNLQPPITTTQLALDYKSKLQKLCPKIQFLMTLYLHESMTVREVELAAASGISGIKLYPKGVTTNSDSGVSTFQHYYPIFKAMEQYGLVLNIHGEVPSDPEQNICVMNAERVFLEHFEQIHHDFPKLKLVLEHASTMEAVEMVKRLGDNVGCTITIHHLYLTVDDWAGKSHHFCKPVAKYPQDRKALQQVILDGHSRFFLGTDSAPHPRHTKECAIAHAGVYTGVHTLALLAHVLESFGALHRLEDFACRFGRIFYGLALLEQTLPLEKKPMTMSAMFQYQDEQDLTRELVPFLAGNDISYSITD